MVRAVLPDGRHALSADQFGEFTLWDLKSGAELRRFKHGGEVAAIAVLPDGRRALSGSTDGTLRLWDLKSGAQLRELKHTRQVGGEYMLGNFKSGQRPYRVVRGDAVLAVAVLPDERRALSGSVDGKLLLWDLESGHEQLMFECGGAGVTAVVVRSDGSHALVASGDGKLRLWDLKRVAEVRQFEHDDIVTAVAVLPDGCRALSGSADRTLRLWDLEDGTELARFVSDDPITAVSANEYRAIIGDTIGRVMIFHITL